MLCPNCKLENPEDAMICDCGYNFESALKGIPQTFDPPTTNKWIEGLKFFAWISFVLCIIGGIVISFRLFNVSVFSGLLVIIASFVIAFTGTAVTMIYIGIAEDIKAIRNHTGKIKTKQCF